MHTRIWVSIIFVICCNHFDAYANERSVSTSVAGMEELLETERVLVEFLGYYADELQKKLDTIKSALVEMRGNMEKAQMDTEAYLSNPINAFSLIRRMHADWLHWEIYLNEPIGVEHISNIAAHRTVLPTSTDLVEASNALHRLQTTYDMKPIDMATGLLNGKQYDARFSALDLYTIGLELFKQDHIFHSSYWLYAALEVYNDSELNQVLDFDKRKIYQVYAENLFKQNRFQDSITVLDKAIQLRPDDVYLLRRKVDVQLYMTTNPVPIVPYSTPPGTAYELGCRGEYPFRPYKLHCRYNRTTNDFLKLAPIKMEEISLDPYMILYHDVISDDEIQHLKELGRGSLQRATVFDETNKKSLVVNTRTSKFSWLNDNTTEVTRRLNRRIMDMTGFDVSGSEMLQVMNYGLGGHYATHHDFFNFSMTEEVVRVHGDRMATVLFYMSELDQGGATVFPRINIALEPKKNSAVMWYNLDNRGAGDGRTLHAACPVIVGSKWVCNKWVRERAQFRSRPCPRS